MRLFDVLNEIVERENKCLTVQSLYETMLFAYQLYNIEKRDRYNIKSQRNINKQVLVTYVAKCV